MPVPAELTTRLERALSGADDAAARVSRLLEDARRLCGRVRHLVSAGLIPADVDAAPMEVCCFALQLPLKPSRAASGKPGRATLKERTEQAAEMLVMVAGDLGGVDGLLDETTQLLADVHHKRPASEQARVLADAMNLEDFGVSGLIVQAMTLARQGQGVLAVADGLEKREQYGYWDARLKDGFHFEVSRQIARKRLESARKVAGMLVGELKEDRAI
ncbi:MAG: hypothetical protein ACAI43_24035 [Phycisphaerae bacterium]